MLQFRYSMTGRWWKGNTHIHSTASDGGKTFRELAELYHGVGYHFLFRTDHWVASDVRSDPNQYPLLWLDGVELDGVDSTGAGYHVVALGSFQGIQRSMGLQQGMEAARAQNGLLILAHPLWMGNTFQDALRWQFDGVEIYNHVCRWLNGKGDGIAYWNAMLSGRPNSLAFTVDDAHIKPDHPGWNGGWVMVNAVECTPKAILSALRDGNFYSTCGPLFESIEFDGEKVSIQCSPVKFARLVGPGSDGARVGSFDGSLLSEAAFKVPRSWQYAYLEIEDQHGQRAWTNPIFINE
ncbi:MAG: hypothetical protein EHM70_06235 [Chloroflexota bacterium]|nr:MAG: hypothetical protein EHM70_06235 [Chloroflexota bacterium]